MGNDLTARLRDKPVWCVWKRVDGAKVPFSASSVANGAGFPLSSIKRDLFSPYRVVEKALAADKEYMAGVMLGEVADSDYVLIGIDIDGTNIEEVYQYGIDVASEWDSYTEVSPSGTGMKIYALISKEDCAALEMDQEWTKTASLGGHIEMTFHRGRRFFAVTGDEMFGFEDLKVVGAAVVNKFLNEWQPTFLAALKEHPEVLSAVSEQGKRSAHAGIDRSGAVLTVIAALLREDPDLEEGDVYDRIFDGNAPVEAEIMDAAASWVADQMVEAGGERQMRRAFERVSADAASWDIHTGSDFFEELEGETEEFSEKKPEVVKSKKGAVKVPQYVHMMNQCYGYTVLGNRPRVIKWNDRGYYSIFSVSDFHDDAADVGTIDVGGRETPISRAWMAHGLKRRFEGLSFDPSNPGKPVIQRGQKYFNVCPPWKVEPKEGDPAGVLKVFYESVCSKPEEADWLLDYLAHLVQKPTDRPSVHPILFGDMGIGKDVIVNLMKGILPRDTVMDFDFGSAGEFNGRMQTAMLVNVPEARDLSYKATEAKMKDYMTTKTVEINEKYVPKFSLPFYARFFFTTNDVVAMPVGAGDRRFVPIMGRSKFGTLSSDLSQDERLEFFNEAYDDYLNGDKLGVFLDFLLKRDISEFDPNRLPPFVFGLNSVRSLMVDGNLSVAVLTFAHILTSDEGADTEEAKFIKTTPGGMKYVIPEEVVALAQNLNEDMPTMKRENYRPRQWAAYLITFARANHAVIKLNGKPKRVWEIDPEMLKVRTKDAL